MRVEWLRQVVHTKPVEPEGTFRWLHNHYEGRYPTTNSRLRSELHNAGWPEKEPEFGQLMVEEEPLLNTLLANHCWTIGFLEWFEFGRDHWNSMPLLQHGAFLAALSENSKSEERFPWIEFKLDEADFAPIYACQLACNAIRASRIATLRSVLDSGVDLAAQIVRADSSHYHGSRWPKVAELSCRAIDLILECALIRESPEAVELALMKDANPNIPVFRVERSFNECHSALSYSIALNHDRQIPQLLLEHGANPAGNSFGQPNHPLYAAIQARNHELARTLIAAGASLTGEPQSPDPNFVRYGSELDILFPRGRNFRALPHDLEKVRERFADVIPFVSIAEKQAYHTAHAQGGYWATVMDEVISNLKLLIEYEQHGLDIRLTVEEFNHALEADAFEGLYYVLGKYGQDVRNEVLSRLWAENLSFGAVNCELLLPLREDRLNEAVGFVEDSRTPHLVLNDGSRVYPDFGAIADADHQLGTCAENKFWMRVDSVVCRRDEGCLVAKEFNSSWQQVDFPANQWELGNLLPAVRCLDEVAIRVGLAICKLSNQAVKAGVPFDEYAEFIRDVRFGAGLILGMVRIGEQVPSFDVPSRLQRSNLS